MAKSRISPMMQQYMDIKEQYQDMILFFRLGDFYEMFFDDAKTASKELELTLTGRSCGTDERAPMCGVPFHSADTYISRLVNRGYKVAICEQTEDPAAAKGLVKRDVTRVITPGTLTSQTMLKENENNYLASVYITEAGFGLSYCDISTGETYVCESDRLEILSDELVKIMPKEIKANEDSDQYVDLEEIGSYLDLSVDRLDSSWFSYETCRSSILRQFHVGGLKGLGIEEDSPAVLALGSLLAYLFDTQKQSLDQITSLTICETGNHMSLDKASIRNLEITRTLYDKRVTGSLLGVLDKTHTAMGSRLLKQWITAPLNNLSEINLRLDSVEAMTLDVISANNIRELLKSVYDFRRLAGRIASGSANGKDMIALSGSLAVLPDLKDTLRDLDTTLLEELDNAIDPLYDLKELIDSAISEDAPFTVKEGGVIKAGYSDELDNLNESVKDARIWIAELENIERERTGIKNLKVGFNKVFGYYLEVTKSYYDQIPENYIRKQTLANAERFITPELKEQESLVLNAEAKINRLEYDLFCEVRVEASKHIREIQETSDAVAVLDVLSSFAHVASSNDYVRPEMHDGDEIRISKGRHPVVETMIKDGIFVSNDLDINCSDRSMLLITGPNMSGKSTYMRQVAIIVLMAQTGCFVPCESASIGIADRIFTRIGASDNLTQGQSTFFVEMSELAYILNTATSKSLIILDEIGRGTSTYDGLSIAWSAVEYLCNSRFKARTLFATHYHEMTVLQEQIEGVRNLNVDVTEENGNIVFLHKIVEGSTSRSYGIHVARLAGVPSKLLKRAQQKLSELENLTEKNIERIDDRPVIEQQISMFNQSSGITDKIREIDLMETTPSMALKILEELKEELKR